MQPFTGGSMLATMAPPRGPYDQGAEQAPQTDPQAEVEAIAPTAERVRELWRDGEDELVDARRDYWLNRAFLRGQQYVRWNGDDGRVHLVDFQDDRDASTRRTVNLFRKYHNTLAARLVKEWLEFDVEPTDSQQGSIRRQSIQEHVLEAQRRQGWEDERGREMGACLLGGTAAVCIEWDDSAKGVKVTDPTTAKSSWIGGVKLSALNIGEFCLEPGSRRQGDALWWIRATTLTCAQAQRRFGLDKEPTPDASAMVSPSVSRTRRSSPNRPVAKSVMVFTYYQRPAGGQPGCIVHVCGDHREVHPWELGFDSLNVFTFRQTPIDDTWVGDTVYTDARQVQVAYNHARTTMAHYLRRAANARLLVEAGSIADDDSVTDEVGEILEYVATGQGSKPEWQQAPNAPRWLQDEPDRCVGELDEMFMTHAISQGKQQGDRNSGLALSILAEKDDTPLGTMAREQSVGWAQIAKLSLQMIRSHLPDQAIAMTVVQDQQVTVTRKWTKADIDEEPVVNVPLESTMPRSTAAVREEWTKVAQAFPQITTTLTGEQVARALRMPSTDDVFEGLNPDRGKALRENESMAGGTYETPDEFDNHPVHIVEHDRFRKSPEYENSPAGIQQMIDAHVDAHTRMAQDDVAEQNPAPPPGGPDPSGAGGSDPMAGPPDGGPPPMGGPPMGGPPGAPPGAPPENGPLPPNADPMAPQMMSPAGPG